LTAPILEEHMKKLLSFGVVASVMFAVSGTAQALECKVKESSMDKPGGFPERDRPYRCRDQP